MSSPRVALVLGAGGITGGAYEQGVLAAITERTGWQPSTALAFIGTSAGSWVAAFLASGQSMADVLTSARPPAPTGNLLRRAAARLSSAALGDAGGLFTLDLHAPRVSPGWWLHPTDLLAETGLFSTEGMARRLRARLPNGGTDWPDSNLRLVAYDARRLRRAVFGGPGSPRATLIEAVTASSAIPGVFRPVEIDGVPHLDGGIASTTHLDLVAEFAGELDLVICIAPMAGDRTGAPPRVGSARYGLALTEPIAWVARRQVEREAARLRSRFPQLAILVFRPDAADRRVMGANVMDGRRRELVRRATLASAQHTLDRADVQQALAAAGLHVQQRE